MTHATKTTAAICVVLLIAPVRLAVAGPADSLPWLAPHAVDRAMLHDDPAIQRALHVIGQAVSLVVVVGPEEIRDIYARIPGAGVPPVGLNGFRVAGDPRIFLNRDSVVYRDAVKNRSAFAVIRLAATLVHEQVHSSDGESAACRRQADFVRSRLTDVPSRERAELKAYWERLETRAFGFALAEKRASLTSPRPGNTRGWLAIPKLAHSYRRDGGC